MKENANQVVSVLTFQKETNHQQKSNYQLGDLLEPLFRSPCVHNSLLSPCLVVLVFICPNLPFCWHICSKRGNEIWARSYKKIKFDLDELWDEWAGLVEQAVKSDVCCLAKLVAATIWMKMFQSQQDDLHGAFRWWKRLHLLCIGQSLWGSPDGSWRLYWLLDELDSSQIVTTH